MADERSGEQGGKSEQKNIERLRRLANDLLDNKIFSSLQIYDLCEGDEELWLKMMRHSFRRATQDQALELKGILDSTADILWYEYLDKKVNKEHPPVFDSVQFVYGDDLTKFIDLVKEEARNRSLN